MSVIDGGSFKCYQHKNTFETVDPKAWNEHLEKDHTESGSAACAVCGTQTEFKHKAISKKAICDKCRKDLTS